MPDLDLLLNKRNNMKALFKTTLLMSILLISTSLFAQKKPSKWAIVEIQTKVSCSDGCNEFKPRIEETLNYTKGVKFAELSKETRIVKVKYNTTVLTPEKIKQIVADTGYEVEGLPINQAAREKLPACCRPELESHGGH